jgi:hypothetical protein
MDGDGEYDLNDDDHCYDNYNGAGSDYDNQSSDNDVPIPHSASSFVSQLTTDSSTIGTWCVQDAIDRYLAPNGYSKCLIPPKSKSVLWTQGVQITKNLDKKIYWQCLASLNCSRQASLISLEK